MSGMKSRPRATSTAVLSAPTNGIASRPVSTVPPITPLRRMEPATVNEAIAPPSHGSDLDSRRAALAPLQLTQLRQTAQRLVHFGATNRIGLGMQARNEGCHLEAPCPGDESVRLLSYDRLHAGDLLLALGNDKDRASVAGALARLDRLADDNTDPARTASQPVAPARSGH